VWKAVFRWLDLVLVIPPSLSVLFDCFVAAAGTKKAHVGFSLIWHATVWKIWHSRNNVIFSNGAVDPGEVVEAIKLGVGVCAVPVFLSLLVQVFSLVMQAACYCCLFCLLPGGLFVFEITGVLVYSEAMAFVFSYSSTSCT
jgi:hypothetical protein